MRLARSVAAVVVALAAAAVGITAAQASPVSAVPPGAGAATLPAKIAPRPVRPNVSTGTTAANAGSMNWSGYVASGGNFTSVTSSWIEPTVTCTSGGVVSFWVGLDGWGDNTVEQTGTGADCRSGSPQYYAWWETFPTNSQQTYGVAVSPGDHMTATVTFTNGQYELDIADQEMGWSKTTTAASPSGATNVSAEVVAEAASLGNNVTQLPDFVQTSFTNASINNQSLSSAGAQPINMVNSANSVIASTATADGNGNFAVTYTGGLPGVQAAYQEADGTLHTYGSSGDTPQQATVMSGTSPNTTQLSGGGQETAYQGTNGDLMLLGANGNVDTGLGMLSGTSPGITSLAGGGFEAAFQANTGMLWTYASGRGTRLGLGLYAGTSPSITTLANGTPQVAFEANTGMLWTYSASDGADSLYLGMSTGTSPSIAALPGGGYMIAFQANTNYLWTYTSPTPAAMSVRAINQSLGMATGTSPSIAAAPGGGYGIAFQANTNTLWTFVSGVGAADQNQPNQPAAMAAGTSPAIVPVSGGYESAFQAVSGDFVLLGADAPEVDTQQSMLSGTSPDLAP